MLEDMPAPSEDERRDLAKFTNMVRSLYNIDADCIPELTFDPGGNRFHEDYWPAFRNNPPRFFITTDLRQQRAIYREVLKRQPT